MKNWIALSAVFITGMAVAELANNKQYKYENDLDKIVAEGEQHMLELSVAAEEVNKAVEGKFNDMKGQIRALEEENKELEVQVKVLENEIAAADAAPVQPFDVLAILPDTAR